MESAVEISSAVLRRVAALVTCPEEQCGLLRGRRARVIQAVPCANVSLTPRDRFEIDPAALIAAHRAARRRGGLSLLGYFHTHPMSDAMPSRADAEGALPDGLLWLIAAPGELRLWRAVAHGAVHGRFDPVPHAIMGGKSPAIRLGTF